MSTSRESQERVEYIPPHGPVAASPPASMSQPNQIAATKALAQTFGLDIRTAILAVIIDMMMFGGEVLSAGLLIPLSIAVASVFGFIAYKIQNKWYGDDHDSALIKALIVGLLTAIPTPLSPIVAIPGGLLGIITMLRKK